MASVLSTYTKKELEKKLKTQKRLLVIHSIVIVSMVILVLFSSIENGFSFSSLFPLCFLPMQAFILIEIKNIKKELELKEKA